ncbi:MAG: EamA family transporter, partial [Sneathiella sp.]
TVTIILGVLCLTGGSRQKARHILNSLLFGVCAGLLIGSYTAWDAYTVSVLAISPLLLDYATSAGRVFLLAPIAFKRRSHVVHLWKNYWKEVLIIALLAPLSYILVLYAMTFTPVIFVAPLREVSVLLSVLAGSLLLGEGQFRDRFIWGIVILGGIGLLATA